MKLYLIAITIFVIAKANSVNGAPSKKKNCDKNVFDNCANTLLMLTDDTFVFPTSIDKMNKRCKEVRQLEKCTKEYSSDCLKGETKNSISVLMYGISKTNKGYCSSTRRKNLFVSFGECLNTHKKKLAKYMEQMNRDFHGIKGYHESKLRIPLACCSYYRLKKNAIGYLTSRCSEANVREVESLIDSYAVDTLNLLCGDYTEESDRCSKIIDKVPKYSKPLGSKVFLLPMVDILDSI